MRDDLCKFVLQNKTAMKLNIIPTNNPTIVKFEAPEFLFQHKSYEYKNIDEAKNSPLAQQLFYLPFVKTVYFAQNFIAIQRFDIVQWEDVQEEVKEQLEAYLTSGDSIVQHDEQSEKKQVPISVYAESTPNPNVLKFVANKKLVLELQEFKSVEDTEEGTLSRKLYQFPFIKEIFCDANYISITKYDIASWEEITPQVREFIRVQLQAGDSIGNSKRSQPESSPVAEVAADQVTRIKSDDPIAQQIIDILEEYIKPAVAGDGGNIAFQSYDPESKTVQVLLQGACSGCPSSTLTLKNGIETLLKDMMNGAVEKVEALNG